MFYHLTTEANLERVPRIELGNKPWQGFRLPLHHTRNITYYISKIIFCQALFSVYLVRLTGLEPVRIKRQILSLLWLPITPQSHNPCLDSNLVLVLSICASHSADKGYKLVRRRGIEPLKPEAVDLQSTGLTTLSKRCVCTKKKAPSTLFSEG